VVHLTVARTTTAAAGVEQIPPRLARTGRLLGESAGIPRLQTRKAVQNDGERGTSPRAYFDVALEPGGQFWLATYDGPDFLLGADLANPAGSQGTPLRGHDWRAI